MLKGKTGQDARQASSADAKRMTVADAMKKEPRRGGVH